MSDQTVDPQKLLVDYDNSMDAVDGDMEICAVCGETPWDWIKFG